MCSNSTLLRYHARSIDRVLTKGAWVDLKEHHQRRVPEQDMLSLYRRLIGSNKPLTQR